MADKNVKDLVKFCQTNETQTSIDTQYETHTVPSVYTSTAFC